MIAGNGSAPCMSCGAIRRAERRIRLNTELLEQPWVRDLYLEFCMSDRVRKSAGNVTARLDNYAAAFSNIDKAFRSASHLSQEGLFALFGAEGLRRQFNIIGFLCERIRMSWTDQGLEKLTEQRRTAGILNHWTNSPWYRDLIAYHAHLVSPDGKRRQAKTVRVYLNAAARLLNSAAVARAKDLLPLHVTTYLRNSPGQAACLAVFVSWLRTEFGNDLPRPRVKHQNPIFLEKALVLRLAGVLRRLNETANFRERRALIVMAISDLFLVPPKQILSLRPESIEIAGRRVTLHLGRRSILLSEELSVAFMEICRFRPGKPVFEGRNRIQNASLAGIKYQITKFNRRAMTQKARS